MSNRTKTIGVRKILIDKHGEKKIIKREIPEVIPGEFDADENILAEIMMDVFFSAK